MPKPLINGYRQYSQDIRQLTREEIVLITSGTYEGFKYFFENCMLMQDRDTRQYIHPKINKGQELIAKSLLEIVDKDTRADSHVEILILGPRQFGKSTILTAISNYIEAFVPGMENLNIVQTMQQSDAAAKFFRQKMEPILTMVHPLLFPNIVRDSSTSSTLLQYKDMAGVPRGGYYEILSASSNSVRSGTVTGWLCDEPSEYRNPEATEDAISGAISSYGWSFTAYIGTFSDRLSHYFLNKIQTAIDNPKEIKMVFIPWFLVYGRKGDGDGYSEEDYTQYDREVVIPEMIKYGIPREEWNNKIGWYHRRALRTSKMRFEFPTSIQDIMTLSADRNYWDKDTLDLQNKNIQAGNPYRILTDNSTGKVEAHLTDISPFIMYKQPVYGHKYRICIDPITARSEDSDLFAMHVMDLSNNEQVATFAERNLPDEDYADWAVSIGMIYNKAELCPEINVANGFIVAVNARRYYHWYYEDKKARAEKTPGLRTTVATKERMLDALTAMLQRDNIIIHDENTVSELRTMIKHIKTRGDGTKSIKVAAKKGCHDDRVMALVIFAGSLDISQIEGRSRSGFSVL